MSAGGSTLKRKAVCSSPTFTFNPQWQSAYFMREHDGQAQCVLCKRNVIIKQYNVSRHYRSYHASDYDSVTDTAKRGEKFLEAVKELESEQETHDVEADADLCTSESATRASYRVALVIARKFKAFSDGEFVKECMQAVAESICPEQVANFLSVPLSASTIVRRIKDLATDVNRQLREKVKNFVSYSVALDESTGVSDTAQLAIFIRGVDKNLSVTEELLDLQHLKGNTTGEDIFLSLEEAVDSASLDWGKLVSVATDGASAMRGQVDGLAGRLNSKLKSMGLKDVLFIHCILHRENLCAQSLKMTHIMKVVVKTVNTVRAQGLKHRQFQEFLKDIDSEYTDIPYFTEVRWLSRGKVLQRFFVLREEISVFMEMLGSPVPELRDAEWVSGLAFLCDIVSHLNCLNVQLQGRDKLITNMLDSVRAFDMKLDLFKRQLDCGMPTHFPSLQSLKMEWEPECLRPYSNTLSSLQEEIRKRFQDLRGLEQEFAVFATPFALDPHNARADLQLELIDLQCDTEMKEKYRDRSSLLDFYHRFSQEKHPRLHAVAARAISIFGTTYRCEQFFSMMKLQKPRLRAAMLDENLSAVLRLSSTHTITPDIDRLVRQIRCNKSKKAATAHPSTSHSH